MAQLKKTMKMKVKKVEGKGTRPKSANKIAKEKEQDRTAVEEHMGFITKFEYQELITRLDKHEYFIQVLTDLWAQSEDKTLWQKIKDLFKHKVW